MDRVRALPVTIGQTAARDTDDYDDGIIFIYRMAEQIYYIVCIT